METTHGAARPSYDIEIGKSLSESSLFITRGKAEYYAEPENSTELRYLLEEAYKRNLPVTVIADGTHVIISDKGIEGLLVSTRRLRGMTIKGNLITAYAGERLADVINYGIDHHLTGLEELGGIPGTIAAALKINASFGGKSISDYHFYTDYMSLDGNIHRYPDADDLFGAMRSPFTKDEIIISVTLKLDPTRRTAEARMNKEKFVELQFIPPADDFAGMIFRNPEGMKASHIIREAGLAGDIGFKADFNPSQSNSIFAQPDCSATELKEIIDYVQAEVEKRTGMHLETLINFLGDFD